MAGEKENYREFLQQLSTILELEPGEEDAEPEKIMEACRKLKGERDSYFLAMDNCTDSFHVTDSDGNIMFINKSFEKRSKVSKDKIIGKNVVAMEKQGVYRPSAVRMALKEDRQITILQGGPGGDAIVTATPVKNQDGDIEICVSNARFIDELHLLDMYYNQKKQENRQGRKEKKLVSQNEEMQKLYEFANQIAGADSSILITGETGTGKSMLARHIHDHSPRSKGKCVELNCAAIPENLIESELFGYESGAFTGAKKGGKPGLFELADGGTLFLDEIGDMPVILQTKLLHAIQNKAITRIGGTAEKKVDVRIIAATNQNLEKRIGEGLFRRDLYYRINVVPLHMPALRERREDINDLTETFLKTFNQQYHQEVVILDKALEFMNRYRWPGNIRELENLIERLVVTNRSGVVDEDDLPNYLRIMMEEAPAEIKVNKLMPLKDALERVEAQLVEMAFAQFSSSYKVAEALEISQSGASRKYLKYVKGDSKQD